MGDFLLFSKIRSESLWVHFRELLLQMKPDVIHLHHYLFLGLEMLSVIRNTLPECKIILTLHEFLAICYHNGQMLKTNGKLCYKSSSRDCHACFPEKSPGDFFLREHYVKKSFEKVDHFVSPSEFLKSRYVEWGLAEDKISVIENGQPLPELSIGKKLSSGQSEQKGEVVTNRKSSKVKFAFFGQVNPFKGVNILLRALEHLPKNVRKRVVVDIHGANLDLQSEDFKSSVHELLEKTKCDLNFVGPYEPREMPKLLSATDWVVVPSIWWENSPMVIQEAFNYRVPLIVSDIGGMEEKVLDEITGLHFRAGNPMALAEVITRAVDDLTLRKKLVMNIKSPVSSEECADMHMKVYVAN
jgi:glycosyltransferase involved in cell wall biosynthesis